MNRKTINNEVHVIQYEFTYIISQGSIKFNISKIGFEPLFDNCEIH